jgi:hypothetical protein
MLHLCIGICTILMIELIPFEYHCRSLPIWYWMLVSGYHFNQLITQLDSWWMSVGVYMYVRHISLLSRFAISVIWYIFGTDIGCNFLFLQTFVNIKMVANVVPYVPFLCKGCITWISWFKCDHSYVPYFNLGCFNLCDKTVAL